MEINKEILEKNEEAWKMLVDKGFSLSERMKIHKAFIDFGKTISNVTQDGEYFKNKNVQGFLFSSEQEAIFAEHLFNFMPENVDRNKVVEAMSIVIKLFDIKSDWSFNGYKKS